MNFSQKEGERIFNKEQCQIIATYSQKRGLQLEVRPNDMQIFLTCTLTPTIYTKHSLLTRYFPSPFILFEFLKEINEDYISSDCKGKITLVIFGEELQETVISIALERQSEAVLVGRVKELERTQRELKELLNIKGREKDLELSSLREAL